MLKQNIVLTLIGVSLLGCLAGCGKKTAANTSNHTTAKSISSSADKSDSSFKGGTFKNKKLTIKITKTQVGTDNSEDSNHDKHGVIVTYKMTNHSKKSIKPSQVIDHIDIKQNDGSSDYDLEGSFDAAEALHPTYNSDGSVIGEDSDDNSIMDAATDKQEAFQKKYVDNADADLLPGKSTTLVKGYVLHNTDKPVHAVAYATTYNEHKVGDKYTINLIVK